MEREMSEAHSCLLIPISTAFMPDVIATIVLIYFKSPKLVANLNSMFSDSRFPFYIDSKNSKDSWLT